MIGRKPPKQDWSAGPRSIRGPAGLAILAVAAALAVVVVRIALPTSSATSQSPPVQAERPSPLARFAATPPPAPERSRDTASPLAALADAIRHETNPTLREERINLLINRLEAEGFSSAMSRLSLLTLGPLGDQLGARIMRHWAENDAKAASLWAASLSEGSMRPISLEQVAIVWSGQDLAGSSEWARTLKVETERDETLRMIAHEAVRTEPVTALAMAFELPAGEPRDQLVLRAASEWATTDPKSAVDWARQISDHTLRDSVLADMAVAWGNRDAIAAATLATKELPPGRLQADTFIAIVQRWAQTDPQAAAQWVAGFPESAMREAALDNLSKLWTGEVHNAPGS